MKTAKFPGLTATAWAGSAAALLLVLTGCGGGSDGTGSSSGPGGGGSTVTSATGRFVDANVQGLDYYIDGVKAGTTTVNGEFTYTPGKTVTFKVGNVTIGTTGTGDLATVTPADLTADATALSNVLVLLQSLDADGNPGNGIVISGDKAAALTTAVDLSAAGSTLASITKDLPTLQLVSAVSAANHFFNGVAAATPNATVTALVDTVVGYWHFQCNGQGYSQVTEMRKASANKIYLARNIGRQYGNANCTGPFTQTPEFGGGNQMDYATVLGAIANADGSTTLTLGYYVNETTNNIATQTATLAAGKNSMTMQGVNAWPAAIVKVLSFAFP